VPPSLVDVMNRLSQNLYINAPTLSQLAAVRAFDPECSAELEAHVARYTVNRSIVLTALRDLDLHGGASPADGAFYVYVDLSVRFNCYSLAKHANSDWICTERAVFLINELASPKSRTC
jgi:aspartate/methionine/tyrosine aminotransferase